MVVVAVVVTDSTTGRHMKLVGIFIVQMLKQP